MEYPDNYFFLKYKSLIKPLCNTSFVVKEGFVIAMKYYMRGCSTVA